MTNYDTKTYDDPAFPMDCTLKHDGTTGTCHYGLTKLDYFASAQMQIWRQIIGESGSPEKLAELALQDAKALMERLAKETA